MAEDAAETMRKTIQEAEAQLAQARDLLDKLRRAGEDVTQAESQYRLVKLRLDRFKRAFK